MGNQKFTESQLAALDITKSVGVTASAGTGKPYTLKNKYIELLRVGAHPGDILCLTYTDKAAAEMRDKIEEELRNQVAEGVTGRLKQGMSEDEAKDIPLMKALDEIHHCTISTFHGFCSSLLREFPIEADVPINYSIMDSFDTHKLVMNTISDVLKHPDDTLYPHVMLLCQHIPKEDLRIKGIKTIYDHWDNNAEWFSTLKNNPRKIYDEWSDVVSRIIEENWRMVVSDTKLLEFNSFEKPKCSADLVEGTKSAYNAVKIAKTMEEKYNALLLFSKQKTPRAASVYGKGLLEHYKKIRVEVKDAIEKLSLLPYENPCTQLMLAVMQAFGAIGEYVHSVVLRKKEEGGYLNFDDLITKVDSLLTNKPEITKELYHRYRYILVDEVQDNDPLLTRIVEILAGNIKEENKLFVVGDMKQSIFGFRGANPEEVNKLLKKFPEKPVELDTNFRTVSPLISVINTIFTNLYPDGNDEGIVYSGVTATRETDVGTVTILRGKNWRGKSELPPEADILASWIKDVVETQHLMVEDTSKENRGWIPATYRDIAILVRTHGDEKSLAKSLKRYRIPYHIYKGKDFYREPEIIDIMNVIRASVFHDDDISLYGALISPYFGVSDEQLAAAVPVSENGNGRREKIPSLWERLKTTTDEGIKVALVKLQNFADISCTAAVSEFVHKIIRECGILTVYATLDGGSNKILNLKRFLEVANAQSASKGISIMEFISMVDTCIDKSIDSDDSSGSESDSENAVHIMTTHVSKGLEYKGVVLYRMGVGYQDHLKSGTVAYDPVYHFGYIGLKYPSEDMDLFAFLHQLIYNANLSEELASEKRLFYVGMTRARDHLVLTTYKKPQPYSNMELFESAAEGVHTETICECLCEPEDVHGPEVISIPIWWKSGLKITNEETASDSNSIGFLFGSCIHEVFEGRDLEETCRKYMLIEYKEIFEQALASFRASDMLNDVIKEWHELSFFTSDGDVKRADMVIKYRNGTYRIIDFKSDDFRTIPDDRRREYFDQLTGYSQILTQIFHTEKPIPACFYSTKEGEFIDLDDILTYHLTRRQCR